MSEELPSNVIDFQQYKQKRAERIELAELHPVEIDVKGKLCVDDLDDIVGFLQEYNISVDAYLMDEEDVKSVDQLVRAND